MFFELRLGWQEIASEGGHAHRRYHDAPCGQENPPGFEQIGVTHEHAQFSECGAGEPAYANPTRAAEEAHSKKIYNRR